MVDIVIGMSDCHHQLSHAFCILNSDVRIDPNLNKHLFSKGVRSVPNRVRLRLSKKVDKNEEKGYSELDQGDKGASYVLVELVKVDNFHHLENENVFLG